MTFIYNENTKKLGEMKGRGNEKPHDKYHPYIIWLLKQKWITGFGPRGYAPEDDFQITDLSDNEHQEVIDANPNFLLTNGTQLSKIPTEVLENSSIFTEPQKREWVEWFSEDRKTILVNIDIDRLIDSGIVKFLKDPFRYFEPYRTGDSELAGMLSYLNDTNMTKLYEEYYKKIILEVGMKESDFMEFDEFSKKVKRDKFFDIFEEYLDAEDDPIDFESESVTFEELKSELTSMNYSLQEQAYESAVLDKVKKDMPDFDIGEVGFGFSGNFMAKDGSIVTWIGEDTEYAIYETTQYFDTDNVDEDSLYDLDIRKVDVDDRYVDTSYDRDDINYAFRNYL
jgi:hypothetical protein